MPTGQLAGDRSRRARPPSDVTGREYQRLHAAQKAREDAETIDIAAIKRRAFEDGHSAGWDAAIGWVIEKMTDVGLDADVLVLDADDSEDGE